MAIFATVFFASPANGEEHKIPGLTLPTYPAVCPDRNRIRDLYEKVSSGKELTKDELDFLKRATKNIASCPDPLTKEDFAALLRWYQILSCNLSSFKNPIVITIFPEDHDEQPLDAYRYFFEQAKSKKAFVTYETALAERAGLKIDDLTSDEKKHLNFFGDGLLSVMGLMLDFYDNVSGESGKPPVYSASAAIKARTIMASLWAGGKTATDLFDTAITDLSKKDEVMGKRASLIYTQLKKIASNREIAKEYSTTSGTGEHLVSELLKSVDGITSEKELDSALESFVTATMKLIHNKMADQSFQFRNISPIINPKEIKRFGLDSKPIKTDWRDRNLAHSGLEMVCLAGENEVTEVILHLGLGHLKGVYEILTKTLGQEKSDRWSIRVDTRALLGKTLSKAKKEEYQEMLSSIPAKDKFEFKVP